MPDLAGQALGGEGLALLELAWLDLAWMDLAWLAVAALVAGLVRGFAGFGTGLIYMPVAAQILPPFWAVLTVALMDLIGPVPNLPSAFRTAHRPDIARMMAGTVVALPLGLWALGYVEGAVFQIAVSSIALTMLVILMTGLRYRGRVGPGLVFGTGFLAGGCGGLTGVPGPPVILLYMASPHPAAIVRASTMLYLWGYDLILVASLLIMGHVAAAPALIGALLILPNLAGNVLGAWLFRPELEPVYRRVAYAIIAGSALAGLPIWE